MFLTFFFESLEAFRLESQKHSREIKENIRHCEISIVKFFILVILRELEKYEKREKFSALKLTSARRQLLRQQRREGKGIEESEITEIAEFHQLKIVKCSLTFEECDVSYLT
jgi:hypothetical protein